MNDVKTFPRMMLVGNDKNNLKPMLVAKIVDVSRIKGIIYPVWVDNWHYNYTNPKLPRKVLLSSENFRFAEEIIE